MRFVLNFAEMRRRYFLNWGKSEARILKKKLFWKKACKEKKRAHANMLKKITFFRTLASDFSKIKNNLTLISVKLRTKTRFSLR